jgi:hypothetical protein
MLPLKSLSPKMLGIALTMILTGSLGYLGTRLATEALVPFEQYVLPSISKTTLAVLSCLLLCISLSSIAWVWSVRRSFSKGYLKKAYPIDSDTGLRYNRKNGTWICPSCFDKDEIVIMQILHYRKQTPHQMRAQCRAYLCGYSHEIENEKRAV